MVEITLANEYGYVVMIAVATAFQCLLAGFSIMKLREKYFNKDFFDRNFPQLKENAPPMGYPDMGNGQFSQKLPLDQWIIFNQYQRAHYNAIEFIAAVLTAELLGGLFYPRVCAVLGLIYLVGRVLYTIGYQNKGPTGRMRGALVQDLALFSLLLIAFWGGFKLTGLAPKLPF
eukprot:TRINITY_DN780_c0_g1_i1.p1 TRINITY_DN780_c0_g1~~TRINITY_DN780_c0_g1_i1.p1  ORF type:complete len:173 (-),score=42.89 TRINITY_DN780_c0_g1_i1:210-728(-)